MYRDPSLTEKPALLEQRGGAFYSEAATALVASLAAGTGDVQVVDVRNGGALPGLQDDDVVELPARVDAAGATPLPQAPLAPELLGLVQHVAGYERLAVRAALDGDRVTARKALLAHPLIGQWAPTDELVTRLLDADVDHLPRFAAKRGVTRMTARVVLAIDGGNSKTDLAYVSAAGELLGLARGPAELAAPPRPGRLPSTCSSGSAARRRRRRASTPRARRRGRRHVHGGSRLSRPRNRRCARRSRREVGRSGCRSRTTRSQCFARARSAAGG